MIRPEGETESKPEGRLMLDAEAWVQRYGDFLFRQAYVRLGKREAAEDVVQEVFLAAWKSRDKYAGRASEQTWLMQILRHKVADYFRRQKPEENLADVDELADLEESQFEGEAGKSTHWRSAMAPRAWIFPWQGLERAEFWQTVGHCTGRMPSMTAQVFILRDVDEVDTEEICSRLNIKTSHLFVLLHRARLAMRRCLELNWFRRRGPASPRED